MSDQLPQHSSSDDLAKQILDHAERVRRLATGQTKIVDLRGQPNMVDAARVALKAEQLANRDVDEFIIDAQQELDVYGGLGRATGLLGYPVHVAYEFAED